MLRNKLIGGAVGGAIGYIIGAIIVDRLYPEYYKPGDDLPYPGVPEYHNPASSVDDIPEKGKRVLVKKKDKSKVVDYTRYGHKGVPAVELEKRRRVDEEETLVNIFEEQVAKDPSLYGDYSDLGGITYEEYLAVRDETKPYFLSAVEFEDMEVDDPDLGITNLTYYTRDDVVVTSSDNRPLEKDPAKLIGENALLPSNAGIFGHPENVVYILNPDRGVVYRIVSVPESFEDTVAGVVKEIQRTRTMKEEDE